MTAKKPDYIRAQVAIRQLGPEKALGTKHLLLITSHHQIVDVVAQMPGRLGWKGSIGETSMEEIQQNCHYEIAELIIGLDGPLTIEKLAERVAKSLVFRIRERMPNVGTTRTRPRRKLSADALTFSKWQRAAENAGVPDLDGEIAKHVGKTKEEVQLKRQAHRLETTINYTEHNVVKSSHAFGVQFGEACNDEMMVDSESVCDQAGG